MQCFSLEKEPITGDRYFLEAATCRKRRPGAGPQGPASCQSQGITGRDQRPETRNERPETRDQRPETTAGERPVGSTGNTAVNDRSAGSRHRAPEELAKLRVAPVLCSGDSVCRGEQKGPQCVVDGYENSPFERKISSMIGTLNTSGPSPNRLQLLAPCPSLQGGQCRAGET